LRLPLWPSASDAKREILATLPRADLVKVSEVELEFLFGTPDPSEGTRKVLEMGPRLAVATLGAEGCYFRTRKAEGAVRGFEAAVVDTTGAGDGFVAGLLTRLLRADGLHPEDLDAGTLAEVCRYANAVGALTTTRKGAIPGLPTAEEVDRFLEDADLTLPP